MQLLSNKTDKDDTNVITVTKKIGELQFEDEEEDSFFTKVFNVCILSINMQHTDLTLINVSILKIINNLLMIDVISCLFFSKTYLNIYSNNCNNYLILNL